MRLTLRTLLAYLDDILAPNDAQLLAEKIRESEFASGLVHRVRNSTRRLRLGAPPLSGKGMGLDPNTVSEYLDNTLTSDRVPDFERVCLESDVHLAEVASCHQVLTLVLGEAADVEERVRDRIYAIRQQSQDAGQAAATKQKKKTAVGKKASSQKSGGEPEPDGQDDNAAVPAYLRGKSDQNRSAIRFAVTLVLSILIVLFGLRAMGPFTNEHPLVTMLVGKPDSMENKETLPEKNEQKNSGPAPTGPPTTKKTAEVNQSTKAKQAKKKSDQSKQVGGTKGKKLANQGKKPAPHISPGSAGGSGSKSAKTGKKKKQPNVSPAAIRLGTYITNTQVLALYEAATMQWQRVRPRATVHAGQRLMALPTYRPQVLLSAGMHMTFVGHTSVKLAVGKKPTNPLLEIEEGRLMIMTVDKAGAQVELNLAGRSGVVTFDNAESEIGIEVAHYQAPGLDPEKHKPQRVIQIFATSGSVSWNEGGKKTAIAAKQVARLLDGDPLSVVNAGLLPAWITNKELTSFDMLSSNKLNEFLVSGRPLSLCLEERIGDRRYEVRSLTLRCLGAMGQFEPCVRAFRDNESRSIWSSLFAALRKAVRSGPEQAKKVRVALEKTRTDDAKLLYRMLWGFSTQQLKASSAKELVDLLEHQQLDVRIFAIENLRQITNKTLRYHPDRAAARRRTPVFKWRDQLKKGSIDYKVQPSPFPAIVPAPAAKPGKKKKK